MEQAHKIHTHPYMVRGGVVVQLPVDDMHEIHPFVRVSVRPIARDLAVYKRGTILALNHGQSIWHKYKYLDRYIRSAKHVKHSIVAMSTFEPGLLHLIIKMHAILLDSHKKARDYKNLSDPEQAEFDEGLQEIEEYFARALKIEKVRIGMRAGASAGLLDVRGQYNPGAIRARLIAAVEDAAKLAKILKGIFRRTGSRALAAEGVVVYRDTQMLSFATDLNLIRAEIDHHDENHLPPTAWSEHLSDIVRKMGEVNERPWLNLCVRSISDLGATGAIRFIKMAADSGSDVTTRKHNLMEAIRRIDRVIFTIEFLGLNRINAELLSRVMPEIAYKPHKEEYKIGRMQKLGRYMIEVQSVVDQIPEYVGNMPIDEYLRGRTASNFKFHLQCAIACWNRAQLVYSELNVQGELSEGQKKAIWKRVNKLLKMMHDELKDAEGVW